MLTASVTDDSVQTTIVSTAEAGHNVKLPHCIESVITYIDRALPSSLIGWATTPISIFNKPTSSRQARQAQLVDACNCRCFNHKIVASNQCQLA